VTSLMRRADLDHRLAEAHEVLHLVRQADVGILDDHLARAVQAGHAALKSSRASWLRAWSGSSRSRSSQAWIRSTAACTSCHLDEVFDRHAVP
jgi:hypothetical protein